MKVLLLAGGSSSEREVSLSSGKAIAKALINLGHEIITVDPSSGQRLSGPDGLFLKSSPQDSSDEKKPMASLVSSIVKSEFSSFDVVFLALHGGEGENGTIQNLLDLAGLKYTGSSMGVSAIAIDKAISKHLMRSIGVRTPDWNLIRTDKRRYDGETAESILGGCSLPVIVKPNNGGSTVGVTKVESEDELHEAINTAKSEDNAVLIEQYCAGRELTVAVLDAHAFPVVEILPGNELYDYESKYTKGKSEYIAPAQIPKHIADRIINDALKVYDVIGASGLARVDFIWAESGETFCLELNTLPGMTELSLAPMGAKCEGVSFDQLIQKMIDSALKGND